MGALENKVAIITGAAKGLGKAIALRYAKEGAKVVVADLDMDGLAQTQLEIKAMGGQATALKIDVSNEMDTQRMAKEAISAYKNIDILVNNAAIFFGLTRKSFMDITVKEWDHLMAVNVKGMWLCSKAVAPRMKVQKNGRIINIGSNVAFMSHFGFTHYLTSKAAVIGLTRSMAGELGEFGITVNNVGPGTIMTEARKAYTTDEEAMKKAQNQLIKRPPEPEDITGMLVYLASNESSMITGQTVVVDGGMVLH